MATSTRHYRLSLLARAATATLVWFMAFATLLAVAPSGAAEPQDTARADAGAWSWPLSPRLQVTRAFERPTTRYGPGHRGIDLDGIADQRVLAVADGVVTHSGVVAGRGTVTVRHEGGIASTYEPVDDRVGEGTAVRAGATIGAIGTGSHCAGAGSCLHLGARLGEDYLDPLLLLARVRIILLPLVPEA